jgi:hypothetical protein
MQKNYLFLMGMVIGLSLQGAAESSLSRAKTEVISPDGQLLISTKLQENAPVWDLALKSKSVIEPSSPRPTLNRRAPVISTATLLAGLAAVGTAH